MAREVIERGWSAVNDEIDTRRGRQVRPGDVVTYETETIHVTPSLHRPDSRSQEHLAAARRDRPAPGDCS